MTAFSLKRSIKQKFQAGHTENESGHRDLTDFTITRSLPYSVTDCGYGLPWPSFPRMRCCSPSPQTETATYVRLAFINKTCSYHLRKHCWESVNEHQVFQGLAGNGSVIKQLCMQSLNSEPRGGSIRNVCLFTLLSSSSTQAPSFTQTALAAR